MKRHFVRTKNFDALELGVESLGECGAREARWMLNTARPGEGKTTNLNHLASRMGGGVHHRAAGLAADPDDCRAGPRDGHRARARPQ